MLEEVVEEWADFLESESGYRRPGYNKLDFALGQVRNFVQCRPWARWGLKVMRRGLIYIRSHAVRIQAAARGRLVRSALSDLRPFAAPRKARPSSVAALRTLFGGRLFNAVVWDRASRRSVPMGTLLARCGIAQKKPTSARQARAWAARVAALHGGSDPGRVFDAGDAL